MRVLLLSVLLLTATLAVVPETSAHNCHSYIPTDCGPCTTGTHHHTYCDSSVFEALAGFRGPVLP